MNKWNPADAAPGAWSFSGGGLTATVVSAGSWVSVRATDPVDAATANHYFEVDITSISSFAMVGICSSAADLGAVGFWYDVDGWGYFSTGESYNADTPAVYGDPYTTDRVGVHLKAGKLYFLLNGVYQNGGDPIAETGYAFSGITGNVYPALALYTASDEAVGAFTAGDLIDQPSGSDVWSSPSVTPILPTSSLALPVVVVQLTVDGVTHYFSDIEYGDAGTRWHDARIVGDIAYSRAVSCILWGDRRAAGGLGNIELMNHDGALDALLIDAQIDGSVSVFVVDQDQPMSAATQIAAAIVTRIEAQGERTIRIVTGDILALLDVPLQSSLYETGDGDASLIGRPRPIAIGNPLSCPIVLVDGVDYDYDCHDSDAFGVTMVRDMGIELDLGTLPGDGYKIATDAGINGITLLQTPVGRVVADVSATTFAAEEIIGAAEGDFATDIADWTTATSGTASATWTTGTAVLAASNGFVDFSFPTALVAGETYSYAADIDLTMTGTAGLALFQMQFRPDSLDPAEYVQILAESTTGTHAPAGTFVAPSAGKLFMRAAAVTGATVSAVVDNVRLSRVAGGGDVADVVRLLLARAGIGESQIAAGALADLDTDRPWSVSYWADAAERIRDVLQQAVDSVIGWVYTDAAGDIAVGYLQPPEALDAAVAEITETELAGEIEIEPDLAPGLSTTVAGARNWYQYGEGELADGVLDADRPILTADYRIRKTATDPVGIELGPRAGASVSDLSASGIPTLLDDATDLQAAADYLADLYPAGLPRRFYRIPCFLRRTELATLKPGDKITLTYPRYGCDNGRDLRVVGIEGRAGDDLCILRAWGSAIDEASSS